MLTYADHFVGAFTRNRNHSLVAPKKDKATREEEEENSHRMEEACNITIDNTHE